MRPAVKSSPTGTSSVLHGRIFRNSRKISSHTALCFYLVPRVFLRLSQMLVVRDSRNATAVNSLEWRPRSERNPRLTQAQSCLESQRDGTVVKVMTIQSVVALRLTPSPANKPGVPLDDSLHPRLLTAVAFATLEFGSGHNAGTRTNSHRYDTPER